MSTNRLKPGSSNTIEVENVRDDDAGVYATNATAVASGVANANALLDATKSIPIVALTVVYVAGTKGTWRGTIAPTVALVDGTAYYGRITVIFNSGVVRRFDIPCVTSADD